MMMYGKRPGALPGFVPKGVLAFDAREGGRDLPGQPATSEGKGEKRELPLRKGTRPQGAT